MVFQDPFSSLNPRLTIGRSIREPLDIEGRLSKAERWEQVTEMLRLVGLLPEHVERYPHEFSGGQRQRAVVARALISRPKLVICDEPVSSLDASVQAQALNLLKNLQEHFSPAYLFISHDLSVVGHMSDRIAVMYLGRIVDLSLAQELFAAPLHPYTQALLAAIPGAGERKFGVVRGDPASPLEPPSGCAFHPRCPRAIPRCRTQRPELFPVDGRLTACWLYS
jgi:oligopeptide/dipeptide ABC transporter ATP-binding protein